MNTLIQKNGYIKDSSSEYLNAIELVNDRTTPSDQEITQTTAVVSIDRGQNRYINFDINLNSGLNNVNQSSTIPNSQHVSRVRDIAQTNESELTPEAMPYDYIEITQERKPNKLPKPTSNRQPNRKWKYVIIGILCIGLLCVIPVMVYVLNLNGDCIAADITQQSQTGIGIPIPPFYLHISLMFGLIVGTMVWAICHVSGGHINPAVTLGATITRKISIARCIRFIIAQSFGAMAGSNILYGVTPEVTRGGLGLNGLNGVSGGQGFGVEVMITFVLVFTVLSSVDSERTDLNGSAPLTIGLSVTVGHLIGIGYTGCSMNPARSFGPAVVMGKWDDHWVFWIGPFVGAFLAAILYEYVFSAGCALATRSVSRNHTDKSNELEGVGVDRANGNRRGEQNVM